MIMDPEVWVAIAFLVFFGLLWKKLSGVVNGALDARADKIRAELEEAERLRDDAQAALETLKKRQAEAAREAEAIIAHAREEADRIRTHAVQELEAAVKRRETQAKDRIAQAEAQAVAEVRNLAVDVAVAGSRRLLADGVKGKAADRLVDQAIADLPRHLH